MTYQSGLVVCIKVNGQILRETQGSVLLPFGSEYSILIKNLKSLRVQVKVSVDGVEATEGTSLVIHPNSEIELKRFIRNGNLAAGNCFKFIERTEEIEEHRGVKADDGLVRIEYWTERVERVEHVRTIRYTDCSPGYPATGDNLRPHEPVSDVGITVPGSESHQQFYRVPPFRTDSQSEVLILRLRGQVGGNPIERLVTAEMKPVCSTCGKNNKATDKFCGACGTALNLL